jgi:hypothetical protein
MWTMGSGSGGSLREAVEKSKSLFIDRPPLVGLGGVHCKVFW